MRTCSNAARRAGILALGALAASLLAGVPAVKGAPPLDPPALFWVHGEGAMTVHGPHCCGDSRFSGRFTALYEVTSAGKVTLGRLSLQLADIDVVVHGGFLDLFSRRMSLHCANVFSSAVAVGTFDSAGLLEFAPATLSLAGLSSEERVSVDECVAPTLYLEATNDETVKFLHDPRANRFGLDTTFHATAEGDTYEMGLHLDGTFQNRPPEARAALVTAALPQGGCPARWRWNGQQSELVAEANDPAGLVGAPYSMSSDPDGAWLHGDVGNERWFLAAGEGDRTFLGSGTLLPSRAFGWGLDHRLEVLAIDHFGASSASTCRFRVVDTTPPAVTAPGSLVLGCTQPGGASGSTSSTLRAFLAAGTSRDVVDRAPARLAPQVGGVDVTDTTLFPVGPARTVSFRFRDFSTNVGQAPSTVTVQDTLLPALGVTLSPPALPPTLLYYAISANVSLSDNCGPVTLRLVSITSNAPAFDAHDIVEASLGTDDRLFYLYARPAGPGVQRIYQVTYEAKDPSGNRRTVTAKVVVG